MDSDRFTYSPLSAEEDIRLLQVSRLQNEDSDIIFTLLHVSTSDILPSIPWCALSYKWGDPEDVMPIRIGTVAQSQIVVRYQVQDIPRSALDMLRTLYESGRIDKRWLWIDAICINQKDIEERNTQLRLMTKIYTLAEETIVYAGPATPSTVTAISFWKRLQCYFDSLEAAGTDPSRDPISFDDVLHATETSEGSAEWIALREHLSRGWFGRTWTIQEAVLSKKLTFVWGNSSLTWEDLVQLRAWDHRSNVGVLITGRSGRARTGVSVLYKIGMLKRNRKGAADGTRWRCDLSFALHQCDETSATDPRDRIYALLGLLHGRKSAIDILPDYKPGNTAKDVFTTATAKWTAQHDSFDLLYSAGIGWKRSIGDLPSWVPDYTRPLEQYPGGHLQAGKGNIADYLQPLVFSGADLFVQVFIVDTVKSLVRFDDAPKSFEINVERDPRIAWYLENTVDLVKRIHPRTWSDAVFETYWRTLTRNSVVNTGTDGGLIAPAEYGTICEGLGIVRTSGIRQAALPNQTSDTQRQRFLTSVSAYIDSSTLCVTDSETMALVPQLSEEGDSIAVCPGARTPFVLRQTNQFIDGKKVFRLVGWAYVHVLNDGIHVSSAVATLQEVAFR